MKDILTGKSQRHLTPGFGGFLFETQTALAIERLAKRAELNGFELGIVSSYRDYEKQKNIWNAKAQGKRVLLDDHGTPLDYQQLSPDEIVAAIMRWSAFPGASRHHWGTDLDVFDRSAVSEDYQVQLTPDEVDGVFSPFYMWLEGMIAADDCEGFIRPYEIDRGGVAPEAWHLSFTPSAKKYENYYSLDFFLSHLKECHDVKFVDIVLARGEEIYERFIKSAFSI